MKHKIFLFLVLVVAVLSRFYHLETLPQAFFTDEAALGYNGWSLLTTGKDEWGQRFPLVMRSFDDYKPAVYSYLTIPGIILFGLNQTTSRLPAAFFGALLPLVVYLVIKNLTKRENFALLTAVVITLTPWHIEVSRTAIESGVSLTLTMISLWLLTQKKEKFHWWALLPLLISLFTYHSARLVAPVILLSGVFLKLIKTSKKHILAISSIFIFGLVLSFTSSHSRFEQISIFSDRSAALLREESIAQDGGPLQVPLLTTRLFHNKPLSYIFSFAESYLANTSLTYLFIGGAQPPRVTIPETGQFLLLFLPFFIIGSGVSIKKWKKFDHWILFWLLFAPVPAALTVAEIPHTYRTLFMLPPIAILIAQGIRESWQWMKKVLPAFLVTIFGLGLIFSIGLNSAKAWHQYRVHQQLHHPWYRQYGYKDLIKYLNSLEKAEKITITNRENEPYIMILFYNQIEPLIYQRLPEKRLAHEDIERGVDSWQMFNYVFSESACPHDTTDINPHNYYVAHFTCELPDGFERVKTINFMDGNPEFFVDHPQPLANRLPTQ
jgi:4-amino-4-deoxy-L-arabinose transferase-like glycosyltransferase